MYEHQLILRRILFVVAGICLVFALLVFASLTDEKPFEGPFFVGALLVSAILGFSSTRWILAAIEALTGFTFFLSGTALLFLYILGISFSIVILPLGLAVLMIQYFIARRRYLPGADPR